MLLIRVSPTCDVLDMHPGFEYEVEPSDLIELLIKTGKLIWVDEPIEDGGYATRDIDHG
jgi:hypothetical protein